MVFPENKLLFTCTRQEFNLNHQKKIIQLCNEYQIDWQQVLDTAIAHQVAPLIYKNLVKCNLNCLKIDHKILEEFNIKKNRSLTYKSIQQQSINKILERFNRKKVEVMLVKGAAFHLTVYQQTPEYLIGGDIDVILHNKREDVSDEEDREDVEFFQQINQPEWERGEHHDISINNLFSINFDDFWQRSTVIKVGDYQVTLMCPEDMLLTACLNSFRKRFFRLKSLLDIAEIINYYPQLDWDKFQKIAQEYNCWNIVYRSLFVTKMTVGCNFPLEKFTQNKINKLTNQCLGLYINYLINNIPLLLLLPQKKINIFNRENSLSLFLKLTTYNPQQLRRIVRAC